MNPRYLLCLANSKKYGERCIAGVELEKSERAFRILAVDNRPKWLRPVTDSAFGAISETLADRFSLLDVIEIVVTDSAPQGYQSENVKFDETSLRRAAQLRPSHELLGLVIDRDATNLFGSMGRAVSREKISSVSRSLMCIKPEAVSFNEKTAEDGKSQIRATFRFQGHLYDLPVTDVAFCRRFKTRKIVGENVYLTISLGLEFEGWHYKLVAGVIDF